IRHLCSCIGVEDLCLAGAMRTGSGQYAPPIQRWRVPRQCPSIRGAYPGKLLPTVPVNCRAFSLCLGAVWLRLPWILIRFHCLLTRRFSGGQKLQSFLPFPYFIYLLSVEWF